MSFLPGPRPAVQQQSGAGGKIRLGSSAHGGEHFGAGLLGLLRAIELGLRIIEEISAVFLQIQAHTPAFDAKARSGKFHFLTAVQTQGGVREIYPVGSGENYTVISYGLHIALYIEFTGNRVIDRFPALEAQ
jgi:hypothetical protein